MLYARLPSLKHGHPSCSPTPYCDEIAEDSSDRTVYSCTRWSINSNHYRGCLCNAAGDGSKRAKIALHVSFTTTATTRNDLVLSALNSTASPLQSNLMSKLA